jgi:hypothetical protein
LAGAFAENVMRYVTSVLLVVATVCFSQSAQAFFDLPWITPLNPAVGEMVSVNIHGGTCDAILEEPGYPQIVQTGNSIRIVLYGVHYAFEDFCIFPIGTATFPVAGFPEGAYTLQVDFAYDDYLLGPTITTLGVVPFTVTSPSAAATPAPTLSPIALLILTLALGLTAWLWCTRQTGAS